MLEQLCQTFSATLAVYGNIQQLFVCCFLAVKRIIWRKFWIQTWVGCCKVSPSLTGVILYTLHFLCSLHNILGVFYSLRFEIPQFLCSRAKVKSLRISGGAGKIEHTTKWTRQITHRFGKNIFGVYTVSTDVFFSSVLIVFLFVFLLPLFVDPNVLSSHDSRPSDWSVPLFWKPLRVIFMHIVIVMRRRVRSWHKSDWMHGTENSGIEYHYMILYRMYQKNQNYWNNVLFIE